MNGFEFVGAERLGIAQNYMNRLLPGTIAAPVRCA